MTETMMPATAAADVMAPASQRLHLIDTLRAFALFGVIVMNIMAMVMALVGPQIAEAAQPVDFGFATFDLVLLQGKARSTFALLFGVGFGILMARAAERGTGFGAFYMRRMTALLALGLANLAFLYWGDILILYALLGMVLMLFRNWSNRAILTLGLVLVILPPLIGGGLELVTGQPMPSIVALTPGTDPMLASAPIYQNGAYLDFVAANLRYYVDHHLTDTGYVVIYELGVLGLFLLGVWTARNGVLADVERWRPMLRWIAWTCIPIGLALSALHATRRMGLEFDGPLYAAVTAAYAGLPIMAFGLVAFGALFLTRAGRWIQPLLSPMGRMALTGYLASNLIGAFVWYGWGMGLMGTLNVAAINAVAIAIFVGLSLFSALWLSVFRFGPVEWLWRSVSYGKVQPIRKASRP